MKLPSRIRSMSLPIMLTLFIQACGPSQPERPEGSSIGGTSTGNPVVALQFSSFDADTLAVKARSGESGLKRAISLFFPRAQAAERSNSLAPNSVEAVSMCFKRLRFKRADRDTNPGAEENIDLNLGQVDLNRNGTDLVAVNLPVGTYNRIELDLDRKCASGASLALTNQYGSFATDDRLTIKFRGEFEHSAGGRSLVLGISRLTAALSQVTTPSQIKNAAESASGSF